MKASLCIAAAASVLTLVAASAPACLPELIEVTEYVWEPGQPVSFCIAPDRDVRAFGPGGQQLTPELRCQVEVWPEWPAEIAYIEWLLEGVEFCGPELQVVPRDDAGWISVLPTMRGGGYRGPDQDGMVSLLIQVCPTQYLDLGTAVYFNSPDIDGDLQVNLGDVTLFAHDFNDGYNYRSDFDWDGHLNLGDLVVLAQGNGASCQ